MREREWEIERTERVGEIERERERESQRETPLHFIEDVHVIKDNMFPVRPERA